MKLGDQKKETDLKEFRKESRRVINLLGQAAKKKETDSAHRHSYLVASWRSVGGDWKAKILLCSVCLERLDIEKYEEDEMEIYAEGLSYFTDTEEREEFILEEESKPKIY